MSKALAIEKISALVDRFGNQLDSYKHSDYNETQTRRDFIDPFFKALGWDIDNISGYAESYREVILEDKIKSGGEVKAPDYAFRLPGGKRLFFVEAKKPSIDVKGDIHPAYQVRRYGWSARLNISIITDFEEFAVYDCTKKPKPSDKSAVSRIKYLTFKEYLSEIDFLWGTFGKESALKGGFDRFLTSNQNKKGTASVDKEFLQSLDIWRSDLALSISRLNPALNEDELNYTVQQTLDRIIFLRICEDRGIESYGTLKENLNGENYYTNLLGQFARADQRYNSGLFDFSKDKVSGTISIDNKTVKNIVNQLYYPESPYEFSVIPVEILGSAYEQFLGKVIRVEAGKKAKIEEKPEVRKAGGVHYTPQYIVEYIVKNTVGTYIGGMTPEEVAKVKIIDPACGSGSFLLGAYQYLLDYHKEYYQKTGVNTGKKESPLSPDGSLTSTEKKRILLNNIFGVDLDANAVEVTKLSLLLKCIEGENEDSIAIQHTIWKERILPTLDGNIKSGNSLVDTNIYESLIDFGEERKIKPFNWQHAFPGVFNQGGFDIVLGNPPYVRQELLGDLKEYFSREYAVWHGMADLYSYFIEKGMKLLRPAGLSGIIVANKWLRANYGEPLRKWMKRIDIKQLIDFGDLPVFTQATTYPMILICSNEVPDGKVSVTNVKTLDFNSLEEYVGHNQFFLDQKSFDDEGWNLTSDIERNLLKKIKNAGVPLGEYVNGKIYRGVLTGLNEAFITDKETYQKLIMEDSRSSEVLKPFLIGRDIKRYETPIPDKYLIFFPKGFTRQNSKGYRSPWKWLEDTYPAIAKHLQPFEEKAKKRYDKGDYWWELRACDYYDAFEEQKIIFPDIALRMQAIIDEDRTYCVNTAYIIPAKEKFLCGILNSNLIQFYYKKISPEIRGGYLRFIRQYLESIPIATAENLDLKSAETFKEISGYVEKIVEYKNSIKKVNTPQELNLLESKIIYYESKINELVYNLYHIDKDEVIFIEKFMKS
ncbi:MAG: hypothetical protein FMNOHCHN_00108 [Ignavibacteriaceae bacterium]|nr:hypothetical protein [Ignavibacteriaceae bacterium]